LGKSKVGLGVIVGVKVMVGVGVMLGVDVGVDVGVKVKVGVKVRVHMAAVAVLAVAVMVACCSGEGPQAETAKRRAMPAIQRRRFMLIPGGGGFPLLYNNSQIAKITVL
jgi:tetrahydrodipicolinate N-succinyltransferase